MKSGLDKRLGYEYELGITVWDIVQISSDTIEETHVRFLSWAKEEIQLIFHSSLSKEILCKYNQIHI